jgi:hypothetical protein
MSILFRNGDFISVVGLARRLRQRLLHPTLHEKKNQDTGSSSKSCLVNGVHMAVVGLSFWPAALACQRLSSDCSETALAEVLAAAETCCHPPTRAYVLAHLCSDYYRVICDPARGAAAAALAEELAAQHGLIHCSRYLAHAFYPIGLQQMSL